MNESELLEEPSTTMEKKLLEQLKDSKFLKPGSKKTQKRGCYYTAIPHVVKQNRISSEELTSLNLDKVCFMNSHT